MTDRFPAQVRSHLIRTADERPADGQLAAAIERVAVTPQHPSFVARLTWAPDRIGPFPTAALRLGLVAALLVLAAVGVALLGAGAGPGRTTDFEGTWTSIDPVDGSRQLLAVGTGIMPAVRFVDEFATGPACAADPVKVFTADGTGTIDGDRLDVTFPDGGGCGLVTVPVAFAGTYDETTDTLVDDSGLTWERAPAAVVTPTKEPVSPTQAPDPTSGLATPTQKCFEVPAGDTYQNSAGAVTLTATIPDDADFAWEGSRDYFGLETYCFAGGPVVITASIVTTVYAACASESEAPVGVAVSSPAEAISMLAASDGYTTSAPTDVTIGGYAATRLEIQPCSGAIRLWDGVDFDGDRGVVYLVDVDGQALGIGIRVRDADDGETHAVQLAEAEEIVASLRIGSATTSSPGPGASTFSSAIHGISVDIPVGWQARPATEPWTGGELDFDSPAADVLFDPTLGDRLYLVLASQPYGDLSDDEWRDGVLAWTCPGGGGGEMWSWIVDGADSWQQAPCNSGSIIRTDTRGFLIRLVVASDDAGLAETYDWDWLKPVLDAVDLRPEEALDAPSR